jgi:DNA polymerase-3 subunit beta
MLPVITALHITGSGDEITFQATDRFVLAELVTTYTGAADFAVNVPGRALAEAVKGMRETVAVCAEDGLFGLSDGDRTVTMRCVEAEFPSLSRIIRTEDRETITLDAGDLTDAIKRAGALSEKEGRVELVADSEGMSVTVPASEDGYGIEHLDASASGDISIGVAPGKLGAALAAIGNGPVTLGFDATGPIFLRSQHDGLTVAVMPKRSNQ